MACTGSEAALINCTYDTITTDCSHFEDAGVQCQGNNSIALQTSLGLQLVNTGICVYEFLRLIHVVLLYILFGLDLYCLFFCSLYWKWHQACWRNSTHWGTCWAMSQPELGHCVWWPLEYPRCYCSLQAAGVFYNWWVIQLKLNTVWCMQGCGGEVGDLRTAQIFHVHDTIYITNTQAHVHCWGLAEPLCYIVMILFLRPHWDSYILTVVCWCLLLESVL